MDRRTVGLIGEEAAAATLTANGYLILHRNVRSRFGEIDLIAAHGSELVFVEVKTRTREDHGRPLDAIDPLKQRRLARLALSYLIDRNLPDRAVRFDAVSVRVTPDGRVEQVEILANAFDVAF